MAAIFVRNLYKSINNVRILNGVSFEVKHKEAFCLLGPNGAGKTTTLRVLLGIYSPDSGDVLINGLDVKDNLEEIKSVVGYLPETPSLYERLTVYRNLEFYGRLFGLSNGELDSRIRYVLDLVGLSDRMNDKVGRLSKGMKQRVALARALINNPEILVLDQPTSDLDPGIARSVRNLIKRLNREHGITLLVCTHNLVEAEEICDKVGIINRGRVIKSGYIDRLKMEMNIENIFEISLFTPVSDCINVIKSLDYVDGAWTDGEYKLYIRLNDKAEISGVIRVLVSHGSKIFEVKYVKPKLEDIYLSLVGD